MKMKLFLVTIVAGILIPLKATAQEPSYSVKSPEGKLQVQYLVEKASSILLLCRYTPDAATDGAGPYLKNVSRKTRISTTDGDYALLSTSHIPIRNEAEAVYAYVKAANPVLNCILEFEKFPYDEPFDLVEEDGESSLFTARGLTLAGKEAVSTKDFLLLTPYSEYGCRYENGVPYHIFDDGNIRLVSTGLPERYDDHYYFSVGFQIVNRGNAPLTVKASDVSASAVRFNKKQKPLKCNLVIMNSKEADKEWKDVDEREVIRELPSTAGDYVANAATTAALSPGVSALGTLGLLAVGVIASTASMPDLEPYMKDRNRQREEAMKQYLTESTVQPGDTLSTFISIKYHDEPSSTSITLSLKGETYNMKY